MYARIARFEGGDPGAVDEQIAEMRTQVEGEPPADAPEEVRTLMETVARFMQLVDRESATFVGITFCETRTKCAARTRRSNRMSPGQGGGGRTAVDIFEVAIDKSFPLSGRITASCRADRRGRHDVAARRVEPAAVRRCEPAASTARRRQRPRLGSVDDRCQAAGSTRPEPIETIALDDERR